MKTIEVSNKVYDNLNELRKSMRYHTGNGIKEMPWSKFLNVYAQFFKRRRKTEEVKEIKKQISEINKVPTKTIIVKEISKKEAKKEIKDFIKKENQKQYYPSEIAEKLNISYDLIIETIKELIDKDEIEVVE